jgi:hypothetical protein
MICAKKGLPAIKGTCLDWERTKLGSSNRGPVLSPVKGKSRQDAVYQQCDLKEMWSTVEGQKSPSPVLSPQPNRPHMALPEPRHMCCSLSSTPWSWMSGSVHKPDWAKKGNHLLSRLPSRAGASLPARVRAVSLWVCKVEALQGKGRKWLLHREGKGKAEELSLSMQQWDTGTGSGLPACWILVTLYLGSVREGLQTLPALVLGEAYNPMTHKLLLFWCLVSLFLFCLKTVLLISNSLSSIGRPWTGDLPVSPWVLGLQVWTSMTTPNSLIERIPWNLWAGSAGKSAYHQIWGPEFNPRTHTLKQRTNFLWRASNLYIYATASVHPNTWTQN